MARRWVVNASPLIIVGKIDLLHILGGLAETLVVPTAVAHKIASGPESDPARLWLAGPGKEHIRDARELEPIVANWDLGRGEGEVLSWAFRHPGFEAILDDLAARKCAAALSIPVVSVSRCVQEAQFAACCQLFSDFSAHGSQLSAPSAPIQSDPF